LTLNFFDLSYFLSQNTSLSGVSFGRGVQSAYGHTRGYDWYWRVEELKMSYVRYRWYDADIGAWISKDPAGYVDGASLCRYLGGMPVVSVDPSGLLPDAWEMPDVGDGYPSLTDGGPTISSPLDFSVVMPFTSGRFTDTNELYDWLVAPGSDKKISIHGNPD
jgi:RHS repeat-associated protein